jgi:hypothetical protein
VPIGARFMQSSVPSVMEPAEYKIFVSLLRLEVILTDTCEWFHGYLITDMHS